jgi:hypothetical protein
MKVFLMKLNNDILRKYLFMGFVFSILTAYSQDKEQVKIVLYVYGLPCIECLQERDSIAEKWNVKYEHIAGCLVERKWLDSIEVLNKNSLVKWEEYYKKDWEVFLRTQLDSIQQEKKRIEAIEIQKKFETFEKVKLKSGTLIWKLNGKENDTVLYSRFLNKISFYIPQNEYNILRIESINGEVVSDSLSKIDFYIKSKYKSRCTLFVYLNNEIIQIIDFNVKVTEPPTWNITKTEKDSDFNFNINSIAVREDEINLLIYPSIYVKNFSLFVADTIINRVNNAFDDEIWKHILSAKESDTLKFEFEYKNEDVLRRNQISFTRGKLPVPKVIIDEKTGNLIIRFLENSTLNSYFEVVFWQFKTDTILYSGTGRILDAKTLSSVKKSSNYEFNFQIKCKLTNEIHTVLQVK